MQHDHEVDSSSPEHSERNFSKNDPLIKIFRKRESFFMAGTARFLVRRLDQMNKLKWPQLLLWPFQSCTLIRLENYPLPVNTQIDFKVPCGVTT